jgi:HAE1 family hydrophobic/amphiphilic exporter-1
LLGDVAEVRETTSEIAGISRTNGEPSLGINVTKDPDANTVEVAEGVEEALSEVRDDLGSDEVTVLFNSAEDVEESVSGLVDKAPCRPPYSRRSSSRGRTTSRSTSSRSRA